MKVQEFLKKYELNSSSMGGSLDGPKNYVGADTSESIGVLTRGRDSDILVESNFETALEMLGGEKEGKVEIIRIGHWACGWIEYLAVYKTYFPGIKIAMQIQASLENYAVLDENDYYERQREAMEDTFKSYAPEFKENAVKCLQMKTDVPLEILEEIKDTKAFEILVIHAYENDCSYRGFEEGFVTERNFLKALQDSGGISNFAHKQANTLFGEIEKAI